MRPKKQKPEVAEEVVAAESDVVEATVEKEVEPEVVVAEVPPVPAKKVIEATPDRVATLKEIRMVLHNLLRISNITKMRQDIKRYLGVLDGMTHEAEKE